MIIIPVYIDTRRRSRRRRSRLGRVQPASQPAHRDKRQSSSERRRRRRFGSR